MRCDKKDYQLLAEAYATVQEQEQLDEVLGFGTGGMGDKLLNQLPTFAPNKAGKANARINTANKIKQEVMPELNRVIQGKGEKDLIDVGQFMDAIGRALHVDPEGLPTFQKFKPGAQIQLKDARKLIFPAATEADGVDASHRYAARTNQQRGYTPMYGGGQPVAGGGQPVAGGGQPVAGGGQPVAGGGQIQNPRGNGVAPAGGETEVQPGSEKPSVLNTIGRGVGNLIGGVAGGLAGGAKRSFDYVNSMGKEDLAKSNSGNNGENNQQQQSDQQQQQQSDQQQQGGQETADPQGLPTMDDLAKGNPPEVAEPQAVDSEAEELEVVDNETPPVDNYNAVSGSDGSTTLGTQVDASENPQQQQQQQVGNKGEIEPTVITPPAPQENPQLPNNPEDEEEDPNKKQLPTLREQYIRPLGGCGFMRSSWGNFNK